MRRRRRLPAADRRRQILAGALRVFAQKGFDGATSRELAEAAGVSEALIYKYFPTKEALYGDLVTLLDVDKDRLTARLEAEEPGAAALIQVLYSLTRMILVGPPGRPKDDSIDRLVGQSLLGDGSFAAAFLESVFVPIVPYLCRCLEAAWQAGEVESPAPPGEVDCFLFHHTVGAIALFSLPKAPVLPASDPEEWVRRALVYSCRGLGLSEAAIDLHLDFERLRRSFDLTFATQHPQ